MYDPGPARAGRTLIRTKFGQVLSATVFPDVMSVVHGERRLKNLSVLFRSGRSES